MSSVGVENLMLNFRLISYGQAFLECIEDFGK